MKQSVTLLCLLAWTTGAPGTSRQSTETFGQWSTLVHVGSPINTPYNDTYAILSRDGLTMYLTSDRPGSVGGDDLWFATRESVDAPWGDPQNMSVLNTAAMDSLATIASTGAPSASARAPSTTTRAPSGSDSRRTAHCTSGSPLSSSRL